MRRLAMIALLCITACSSTPDATPTSSLPDSTTTAAPSTTVPPTTTTEMPATSSTTTSTPSTTSTTEPPGEDDRWLQDEFPEFDMTVDDPSDLDEFVALVEEFFVYQSWVSLHPTADDDLMAARAATVLHPDGPRFDGSIRGNQAQIDQGFRLEVAPSEQTLPAFAPGDDGLDGRVVLTLRELGKGTVRWLDLTSDDVQREVENAGTTRQIIVELRQATDGAWRIWDVVDA